MPATAITNPVSGESLAATEPQLAQQAEPGWRRRLNLFTGRALTDTALDNEQLYRAGLLATLGQSVTAGTVTGLALALDTSGIEPILTVSPGYGITAAGEDVVLPTPLKTALSTLPVIDVVTGGVLADPVTEGAVSFHQFVAQPGNAIFAGVLVLQPVVAQVSGQSLATGNEPVIVSGNLGASCDQDPAEYAFDDWQIADAVRLAYLPWPAQPIVLPPQNPAATWRNRLAYALFEAEERLGPDEGFPWSLLGVPVALIAFDPGIAWQARTQFNPGQFITDPNGNVQQVRTGGISGNDQPTQWSPAFGATTSDGLTPTNPGVTWVNNGPGWKPLFADCSAVVRAGGLPRNRYLLPGQLPPSLEWHSNTAYASGSFILDSAGNVQVAQAGGTSGAVQPSWSTTFGQATADGATLKWTNNGPGSWQPKTAFGAGQFLADPSGNLQRVLIAGISGDTQPIWNGIYLPTTDGSITWTNNGSGRAPVAQPALAQARINQLAEQLGQTAQPTGFNLANVFATLPPSGIIPAAALDFAGQKAPWLPRNWSITAAPVHFEELETALQTGILEAPIAVQAAVPTDPALVEPVEVLIPLPDALYDPMILVHEQIAPVFQQEVNHAADARNLTLQKLATAERELNALYTAFGPSVSANPNLIDPDAGLAPDEKIGRNAPPPYTPAAAETFGTVLQSTWLPGTAYAANQFVVDSNGMIQVVISPTAAAGTSGTILPAWNTNIGATTPDGGVIWLNNGPWAWQANTAYVTGQFVLDSRGFMQMIQRHPATIPPSPSDGGTSALSPPNWNATLGGKTIDGIIWQAGGNSPWQPDHVFTAGQLILDSHGNIQIVHAGGISGDAALSWNQNPGQATQDSGVIWNNLGRSLWRPGSIFASGQAILDSTGKIQLAQIGGTSGLTPPAWIETLNASTQDTAVTWTNNGPLTWQPNKAFAKGQIIPDGNGNRQFVTLMAAAGGTSGATQPVWNTNPGGTTADGQLTWTHLAFDSTDVLQLKAATAQPHYNASYKDAQGASHSFALIIPDDLADLDNNGLPHFLNGLNAKIAQANDLLDTTFLTAQTDIYRYRQNVLGATAASTLATSPILANIATGETATATAEDLRNYINTVNPPKGSTTPTPVFIRPVFNPVKIPITPINTVVRPFIVTPAQHIVPMVAKPAGTSIREIAMRRAAFGGGITKNTTQLIDSELAVNHPNVQSKLDINRFPSGLVIGGSTQVTPSPSPAPAPTPSDITNQSPIAGAQVTIRTLTIAERLQQSPSQEAMFYSIGNRLSFLQSLEQIGLVFDDLPILADQPATTPPVPPSPTPAVIPASTAIEEHRFSEWLNPSTTAALRQRLQNPYLNADSSEATVFSVGVRVVEQHTAMLRQLEARVQQYADFAALCAAALANLQNHAVQAGAYITQLRNSLLGDRQNVAFTTALLNDENLRIKGVNDWRQQVLKNSVQLVAYTRARTLTPIETTPSRPLIPGSVASPVPACLHEPAAIPPELREIVGLLREAPVSWLPAAAALVNRLERPVILMQLAISMQARASQLLASMVLPSSADGEPGVYKPAIAAVYNSNHELLRNLQMERAAFQPAAIVNLSWSRQVVNVQGVVAVNDLIASGAVHAEVTKEVARLVQQIDSVATCLYTRVSTALPVDRLAWAEYLRGVGISAQLRSLAILPNWNQLAYTVRQQMQLLVDWLFQQIDTANGSATAFMSDVVRTAILLASDVPVDNIIPGHIVIRTRPVVGGAISLNLPSDRIASGMFVNLYAGSSLAARAVVSDLDTSTVTATVTHVFTPGVYLEAADTVHFTAQTPHAVALRPLLMGD